MSGNVGERPLRVGVCLSLSGKFARFGTQAARALRIWQSMDGAAELVIEDDESSPRTLEARLPRVASRCDILLGPYSTRLARRAGDIAAAEDRLLWNHGGSGDDVESGHPGHVVSVLTPTSRYAEPFLRHVAGDRERAQLRIANGKGSFGRQAADGAAQMASLLGMDVVRIGPEDELSSGILPEKWDLFAVGQFEDDVETVKSSRTFAHPTRHVCAVAAGVREFAGAMGDAEGVFGIAQWFPGSGLTPEIGPAETGFLTAYSNLAGTSPDYPAVQAVAGAALAVHCARLAGGTTRDLLWSAAAALDTDTLFGAFRIDPVTGVQVGHETVLVRWTGKEPARVPPRFTQ